MDPPGRFWYKQAPSRELGYGYNGRAMTGTSYLCTANSQDLCTVREFPWDRLPACQSPGDDRLEAYPTFSLRPKAAPRVHER